MPLIRAALAGRLWREAGRRDARAFRRALSRPGETQDALLKAAIQRQRPTTYGREIGLERIRSRDAFQAHVPITDAETCAPWIERIARGEPGVLTSEPVRVLEPTGGSSGGTHLVPFTDSLQREFRRAVAAWIDDLWRHDASILHGPAYWSVSPATGERHTTSGGIPIGFLDDAEYLSPLHRLLSSAAMAVPPSIRHIQDPDDFQYATLRRLVSQRDLALVSVWNPTYFSLLLDRLPEWRQRLVDDVASGASGVDGWDARQRPDERRAREVDESIAITEASERHRALWPALRLVSAWADAHAAQPFADLAASLPQAFSQPKGLLATEGVISIPRVGRPGAALALTSHVVEFQPLAAGRALWADEVARGERYEVLLTTAGGLTRYRLGDIVEIVGFEQACPLIRFVGRATPVSDRVGEKLHDAPVRRALGDALATVPHRFALVAPEAGAPDRYVLYVETGVSDEALWRVAEDLDERLCENVHYALARRLEQLGPLCVFRIARGGTGSYLEGCQGMGQRLGDIKPVALHAELGWCDRFTGAHLVPASSRSRDIIT